MVLIDGVRSAGAITEIRTVIGDKPLLFNQIAGGKSARLSLPDSAPDPGAGRIRSSGRPRPAIEQRTHRNRQLMLTPRHRQLMLTR
ncbi:MULTISPECIES: hypothetical protein [unclassified Amycolatopsis]|uniref:hypothetical protein n=1 Tax=unclassified Amycolatopsis TaxID=2618356 RepID=UPI002106587B|nr:hypothetical protein [Amycolatopsis sp. DSM 110486]